MLAARAFADEHAGGGGGAAAAARVERITGYMHMRGAMSGGTIATGLLMGEVGP